jgi:hypothetical protein
MNQLEGSCFLLSYYSRASENFLSNIYIPIMCIFLTSTLSFQYPNWNTAFYYYIIIVNLSIDGGHHDSLYIHLCVHKFVSVQFLSVHDEVYSIQL